MTDRQTYWNGYGQKRLHKFNSHILFFKLLSHASNNSALIFSGYFFGFKRRIPKLQRFQIGHKGRATKSR